MQQVQVSQGDLAFGAAPMEEERLSLSHSLALVGGLALALWAVIGGGLWWLIG